VDEVVSSVAVAYGIGVDEVLRWRRGRGSEARKVGMYLVKRLCDMILNEVAAMFGVSSYGVVGWACNWVKVKMEKDRRLRKKLEEIRKKTYKQKI
jgi:chromosomal replication initiation ATPase DnaA